MVVLVVIAAFAVMALAAIAGTGAFGEWSEPVTDRPKGHLPDGDVDARFFDELVTPTAPFGYARAEVDALYAALAAGALPAEDPRFTVERGGYEMAFVDEVLQRALATRATEIEASPASGFGGDDRMGGDTT